MPCPRFTTWRPSNKIIVLHGKNFLLGGKDFLCRSETISEMNFCSWQGIGIVWGDHGMESTRMDILIVDDNADYLRLLRDAFLERSHTVHTAEDGIEGRDILLSNSIDLIISDIRMPRFNGLKLHDFARKIERYRGTKFIFISAYERVYRDALNLDPALDFFMDKLTSTDEIIEFVDKQMSGDSTETWH